MVYFVYVFVFLNNVKFLYVEHSHLWSLNIFCNPLLQNIFQVKCLTVDSLDDGSSCIDLYSLVRVLLMKAKEKSWANTSWGLLNLGLVR